jgi:beta-mannosidase
VTVTVARACEISGHTIIALDSGWETASASAGTIDHQLAGLEGQWLAASVPGTVASALEAAGITTDAHGGSLDDEDWWFRCRFPGPGPEPDTEAVLRLQGLATMADVWLNGVHQLSSSNMHIEHGVVVDDVLAGDNELVIGFRALTPLLSERRPRPRWRTRVVRAQTLRWFRTMVVGRAPGFAPGPAAVGPWRPITLEVRRHVAINAIRVTPTIANDTGTLRVGVDIRPLGAFVPGRATLVANGPTGEYRAALDAREGATAHRLSGAVEIPRVARWWPSTHGTPALYHVAIELEGATGDHVVIDLGATGFRTVEPEPSGGFGIRINGVPVFCRGASLMPDRLSVDLPHHELEHTLILARDAGMNMIRVPGIATYGSEALFDRCDELGLTVWQDFPFANMDYPIDDEAFESSVAAEIAQFLAASGRHPSLAVLCGSSEVEQQVAMLGLDPDLGLGRLFTEVIPGLIHEHEVNVPYVSSTPTGGDLPFQPNTGVAHYFGVGAYRRPLHDARRADVGFAAECLAFANVPDDVLLAGLAPEGAARLVHHPAWKAGVPRDVGTGWDFDDVRDHYLREVFGVDPVEARWADPDRYLDLSRAVSGEVMAEVFGELRRARSGARGALVWWLNDILPGAGWGVLDTAGHPKAAYWYLLRALAPTAVWMTDEGTNGISVHVSNDGETELRATLEVATFRSGELRVEEGSAALELPAHTTVELSAEGILGRFVDIGYAYRFGPPGHDLVTASLLTADRKPHSTAVFFPHGRPFRQEPIGSLGLTGGVVPGADGLVVRLSTARLAYGVRIEAPGHRPDDNWFTMPPGTCRDVALVPEAPGANWQGGSINALNATGSVRLAPI